MLPRKSKYWLRILSTKTMGSARSVNTFVLQKMKANGIKLVIVSTGGMNPMPPPEDLTLRRQDTPHYPGRNTTRIYKSDGIAGLNPFPQIRRSQLLVCWEQSSAHYQSLHDWSPFLTFVVIFSLPDIISPCTAYPVPAREMRRELSISNSRFISTLAPLSAWMKPKPSSPASKPSSPMPRTTCPSSSSGTAIWRPPTARMPASPPARRADRPWRCCAAAVWGM